MNPVFIFLVLIGAVVLWFMLSGLYRLVGGIAKHFIDKTSQALNDEPSNTEMFIKGFKDSFDEDKEN